VYAADDPLVTQYAALMKELASYSDVYMKLSGAFGEMEEQSEDAPRSTAEILDLMRPWLDAVFAAFEPGRIMFGSDWPVCNFRGPGQKSWGRWQAVVETILEERGLSEDEKASIWRGTAVKAYRIET
jgi:L-rhamnono-1,4-lactonase